MPKSELYKPYPVLRIAAELGEHPVWRSNEERLYWLDIEDSTINRFDPGSGENTVRHLPFKPGCYAFRSDGNIVIAGDDGFYAMDFASGEIDKLLAARHDASMRFNDGRADRQGRFWVSTVRKDMNFVDFPDNTWFRLDDNGLEGMFDSQGVPNGTAFSPDGKRLYRVETMSRQVFVHDYDPETGVAGEERLFAQLPFERGAPDGATVDTRGGYWCAMAAPQDGSASTGGVLRLTPDGEIDRYIPLPVPMVTMVAFGGPDLSTLYVTTARLSQFMLDGVPEGAGDIYAIETEFSGEPEPEISVTF